MEVAPETPQETMAEMEAVFADIDFGTDKVEVRHSSNKSSKAKFEYTEDVIQLGISLDMSKR